MILVVRVVQHGVEMHLVDPGNGADIAGYARLCLNVFGAIDLQELVDLDRLAGIADE